MLPNPMHRQVLLLATTQALFQTAGILVMTVGGLAGGRIAPVPELATAPIAAMFLGNVFTTVPAALWMAKVGRRVGFIAGASLGAIGGALAAFGIAVHSLFIMCLGTMLVGAYQAFALYYRFAASEIADEAFRPRAISLVLTGGVVAAVVGPALAKSGDSLGGAPFVSAFAIVAGLAVVAAVLLLRLRIPPPPALEVSTPRRPLAAIVRQPTYFVALFGAATGQGIMVLAMTASPLAIVAHHHTLAGAATAIQFHVLGMFLPSFFTGSLISRFGVLRIMFAGVALLGAHVLLSLSGTALPHFVSALTFLGVGWNFLFIGGTTLLTEAYTPAEKGRAQAVNDLIVVSMGLVASLSAGALLAAVGWQTMNAILLPWLALAALALLWLARRRAGRPAQA